MPSTFGERERNTKERAAWHQNQSWNSSQDKFTCWGGRRPMHIPPFCSHTPSHHSDRGSYVCTYRKYNTYKLLQYKVPPKRGLEDPRISVACTLSVEIRQVTKSTCAGFLNIRLFTDSNATARNGTLWIAHTGGAGEGTLNGCNGRAAQSDASGITFTDYLAQTWTLLVSLAHKALCLSLFM